MGFSQLTSAFMWSALAIISLASCSKPTTGACKLSDGSSVNTFQIFGKWKKVSGYADGRSAADMALNYDILVIQPGNTAGVSRACLIPVENGTPRSTALFKATYEHDVDAKKITYTYDTGSTPAPDPEANYSFAGSCSLTQMVLDYASGDTETYELINQEVTQPICDAL